MREGRRGTRLPLWAFILARDYEGALEIADDVANRYPSIAGGQSNRATILVLLGRMDEAVAAPERAVELEESIINLALLSWTQASAGREQAARKTLARQKEISSHGYSCPYETAIAWAALHEHDRARDLFERGIEERAICWAGGDVDPRVDPLRELAWFQDLLARRTTMGPDDADYVPLPDSLSRTTDP